MKKVYVVLLKLISIIIMLIGLLAGMVPTQVKPINFKLILVGFAIAGVAGLFSHLLNLYIDKINPGINTEAGQSKSIQEIASNKETAD